MAGLILESEVDPYRESCSEFEELKEYIKYVDNNLVKELNVVHINVCSLRKNWVVINNMLDFESKAGLDVIVLTESSIYEHENSLYTLKDYNVMYYNRQEQKGGGICLYVKEDYEVKKLYIGKNAKSGHESVHIELKILSKIVDVIAVYRPPEYKSADFIIELDSVLEKINQSHDIILIGDMNIDLLTTDSNQTINYQNVLSEYGLSRAIYGITREVVRNGKHEKSCIDHIYVRTCRDVSSAIIHAHVADHYMVGLTLYVEKDLKKKDEKEIPYNVTKDSNIKYDEYAIKNIFRGINWDDRMRMKGTLNISTETVYKKIQSEFVKIYDCNSKEIINRNRKRTDKGWITGDIRSEIHKRDKAFKKWKATPTNIKYRDDYKLLRNRINQKIRDRKNEYYVNELDRVEGNLKKTWIVVNEIIGRKKKGNMDKVIVKSFGKQYSMTEILEGFAEEYTKGIKEIIHECNIKLGKHEIVKSNYSMFIPTARCVDVRNIIKNMNSKKAPGIDKIRLIDVRNSNHSLVEHITKLINLSIAEGIIPNDLKTALIKPIYKQGLKNEFGNYRPIAILSTLEKILEHYVSMHIKKYIVEQNIISEQQYGFQRGRSTATLLKKFTDVINSKLNKNRVIIALFIDYKKAFDTINHRLLIETLDNIGVRGKLLKWFKNYLEDRSLRVKICNELSNEHKVKYGVPQGSILGPTLYNIYVNTVFDCVENSEVYMFADDMAMLSVHVDVEMAKVNLQQDYNKILLWTHDRGLKINEKKTKFLVITTSKKNITGVKIQSHNEKCLHDKEYDTGNCKCTELEEVKVVRYLGMLIDNRFVWTPHIENICKSLRACLAQFYRLQFSVGVGMLKQIYYALVHSIVRYGLQCYGHSAATHLKKIEVLNKKIIKIIVHKIEVNNGKGIDNIYKIAKILPIDKLYVYMTIVENYYKAEYKIPLRSTYNFRRMMLKIPLHYNKYGGKQDNVKIPKIMNTIPIDLRQLEKIGEVKTKIKEWLLNNK